MQLDHTSTLCTLAIVTWYVFASPPPSFSMPQSGSGVKEERGKRKEKSGKRKDERRKRKEDWVYQGSGFNMTRAVSA